MENNQPKIVEKGNLFHSQSYTPASHQKTVTKAKHNFILKANTARNSPVHNHVPLSLYNRFSVLQDDHTDHDSTRVALSFTPAHAGIKCPVHNKRQHSQECKQPPFLGTNPQSQLTVQEITLWEGNKNKSGSLERLQLSTKKEDFKKMFL